MDVREKHRSVASCMPPNQGPSPPLRMRSDQELNQRPFAVGDDAQPSHIVQGKI